MNTLCHELAHLRHFNHGLRFRRFYLQILEFARAERIYSPGPALEVRAMPPARSVHRARPTASRAAEATPGRAASNSGPLQLMLFGTDSA